TPPAMPAKAVGKNRRKHRQNRLSLDGWERFQTPRMSRRRDRRHIKTDRILLCTILGGESLIHGGPGLGSGAGESLMRSLQFDDLLAGTAVRTATACTLALALYAGP